MPRPRSSTFYLPLAPVDAPISLKAKLSVLPPQAANALLAPRAPRSSTPEEDECTRLERVLGLSSICRSSTNARTGATSQLPARSVRIRRRHTSADLSDVKDLMADAEPPCAVDTDVDATMQMIVADVVVADAAAPIPMVCEPCEDVIETRHQPPLALSHNDHHPPLLTLPSPYLFSPLSPGSPPTPAPMNGFFSLPTAVPEENLLKLRDMKPLGLNAILACRPRVSSCLAEPTLQINHIHLSNQDARSYLRPEFRMPCPPPPPTTNASSSPPPSAIVVDGTEPDVTAAAVATPRQRYRLSSSCELARKVLKRSIGSNPWVRLEAVRKYREQEQMFSSFETGVVGGVGGIGYGMLGKFDWETSWPDFNSTTSTEEPSGSMFWDMDEDEEEPVDEMQECPPEEESVFRYSPMDEVEYTHEVDAEMMDEDRGRTLSRSPPRPLLLDFEFPLEDSDTGVFVIPPSPLALEFTQNTTPTASSFTLPSPPASPSSSTTILAPQPAAPWTFGSLRNALSNSVNHLVELARSRSPSPLPWLRREDPSRSSREEGSTTPRPPMLKLDLEGSGSSTPKRNLSTSSFGSEPESESGSSGTSSHGVFSRSPSPDPSLVWDTSYALTPRSRPIADDGGLSPLHAAPLLSPRTMPGTWDPSEWDESVVLS